MNGHSLTANEQNLIGRSKKTNGSIALPNVLTRRASKRTVNLDEIPSEEETNEAINQSMDEVFIVLMFFYLRFVKIY